MKAILLAIAAIAAGGAACTSGSALEDSSGKPPLPDASDSGWGDALEPADAGPCSDCEFFPETCSSDTLCPNVAFAPDSPDGLDLRTRIHVIRGRSVSDVWAAGALGAISHFDGVSWSRSDPGSPETMHALWLRDSTEVALGASGHVFARGLAQDGGAPPSKGGWVTYPTSIVPGQELPVALLTAAWASPGADWLWCTAKGVTTAEGTPGMAATTGLWRLRTRRLPVSQVLVFQAGAPVPTSVCQTVGCTWLSSIHGASVNELWAVGNAGATTLVTNANSDTPSVKAFNSQTKNSLNGVWVASASEAWAVGAVGTIRHYTGNETSWDVVADVPTTVDLNAVWGFSSTDVWIVGDAGVVLHYDGKSWSRLKIGGLGADRPSLTTVWGAAPGHVWIGGEGVILSIGGKP